MKVYLAGKMRGLPEFNFPAFHAAAKAVRKLGFEVLSPAELDEAEGFDPANGTLEDFNIHNAMSRDIRAVLDCDGIVLLPGWETSEGAGVEKFVAEVCGKTVFEYLNGSVVRYKGPSQRGVASLVRGAA